jgi:hypothetical protein
VHAAVAMGLLLGPESSVQRDEDVPAVLSVPRLSESLDPPIAQGSARVRCKAGLQP